MKLNRVLGGAALAATILLALGCTSAPAEVRIDGVSVPAWWIEQAEKGTAPEAVGEGASQARICLALSRKLRDRDALESVRYLLKGAALGDGECSRQYLAFTESPRVTLSQRVYARLFLEGLLRRGPLRNERGEDLRGDLYYQLCWAWKFTEPCSPGKVRQVLEGLLDLGPTAQAASPFITQLKKETGVQVKSGLRRGSDLQDVHLFAGESAEAPRVVFQLPLPKNRREDADPRSAYEANAWGGGSDRLLTNKNVLAFLVNDRGEPSYRGTQLWICNLGDTPAYLTSLPVGQSNLELVPGRPELLPLAGSPFEKVQPTTGIPLAVRRSAR